MASTFRREVQVVLLRFIRKANKVEVGLSDSVAPGEAIVIVDRHEVPKLLKQMAAEEEKQEGREQAEADLKKQMWTESAWNKMTNTASAINAILPGWNEMANTALVINALELGGLVTRTIRQASTEGGTASLRELKKNWSFLEENDELEAVMRELMSAKTVLQKVELEMGTGLKGGAARERDEEGKEPQKVQAKDDENNGDSYTRGPEGGVNNTSPRGAARERGGEREKPTYEKKDKTSEEEGEKPQKAQTQDDQKNGDSDNRGPEGGVNNTSLRVAAREREGEREKPTYEKKVKTAEEEGETPQKVQTKDDEKNAESDNRGPEGVNNPSSRGAVREREEEREKPTSEKKDENEDEEDEKRGGLWELLSDLFGF